MNESKPPAATGRGSHFNPKTRFQKIEIEPEWEHLEHDPEAADALRSVRTDYFLDASRTIISENDSPDLPFRYSLNVYRGCSHGCSYCFARPSHEYLDFGAGIDFETKIFVKPQAPELLRDFLAKPGWTGDPIAISTITDCYQPIERHLQITRRCLQVAAEFQQSMAMITKNALVTRDIDVLQTMAEQNLVRVAISLTSLDQSLTRVMEPRTSSPQARLRAVRELTAAGIPVHVLLAPIIPGLTDFEIPALLEAAKTAGAVSASYILLRLPLSVEPVFREWLAREFPEKAARVESLIRQTRDGKMYRSGFGVRMRGTGEIADQIGQTFAVFAKKFGLDRKPEPLDTSRFRPPKPTTGQLSLFD